MGENRIPIGRAQPLAQPCSVIVDDSTSDPSSMEFALTLLFALVTAVAIAVQTGPLLGGTATQDIARMLLSGAAGGLIAWFLWRYRKGDYTSDR